MNAPRIKVSVGELVDKVTILRIKAQKFTGYKAVAVRRELDEIDLLGLYNAPADLVNTLAGINAELWDIEDAKRDCMARHDYGAAFRALSRSVAHLNDERARVKRQINEACQSEITEVKSHAGL